MEADPESESAKMYLAVFDLDNTLIAGDSDVLWTEFLAETGILGEKDLVASRRFYRDYEQGRLQIFDFLRFQLEPLTRFDRQALEDLRSRFIEEKIRPIVLPRARSLLEKHLSQGHERVILTATNRFVTEPIARLLGVETLLATEPEVRSGRYTGEVLGEPSFREGKVKRLRAWLRAQKNRVQESWAYGDSQNDIPLLEYVTHPVAVDPDPVLEQYARQRSWPVLTLREGPNRVEA